MLKTTNHKTTATIATAALILSLAGCGSNAATGSANKTEYAQATQTAQASEITQTSAESATSVATSAAATTESTSGSSDIYTDRDLQQVADTSNAKKISLTSGQNVDITEEGVYVLSGTATNVSIRVNVDNTKKVQLVLDGVSIENTDTPAIYVLSADKVFVTTVEGSQNTLSVTGSFVADGETNLDGVIFSKDDLVLNGKGTLTISSTDNAVVSKDDLKVTGGTYVVSCWGDAFQANDEVYVADGSFDVAADSDGIQGGLLVQIDGGTFNMRAAEGIESTQVRINDGNISISATDDGINATYKTDDTTITPSIEINGGTTTVEMGAGDTDALDSNGNIVIAGGTVTLTGQSVFDFDGTGELTGGTVYVNGEQVTTITNSMMMGGGGMAGGGRMMDGAGGGMAAGGRMMGLA